MITLQIDARECRQEIKFTTFSDGTETCTLENTYGLKWAEFITVHVERLEDCTRDLFRIALVKDALDILRTRAEVTLSLRYMPQARADKVFGEGMPLPIKVAANFINSMNFDEVVLFDPHSEVTPALVNKCSIRSQAELVMNLLPEIARDMPNFMLVAPDNGAAKKTFDCAKMLAHDDFVQGFKNRNVLTGEIMRCGIDRDVVPEEVLMIDDISDGGASFKFLAKKLRAAGAKKVGLYVTHGIFSKGLEAIREDIDFLYVYNIVDEYIDRSDIEVFNEFSR